MPTGKLCLPMAPHKDSLSMNQNTPKMQGSMTALVTPFRDGAVDFETLSKLVDRQIEGGTGWLVPCGTTGESPTLSYEEHDQIIAAVIERCKGRCPVMAGAGSNSTAEAVRLTRHAAEAGADAVLSVVPYYNRPPQEGLFRHFSAVAEAVELPVVLYNVPFRTGCALENKTVIRLRREFPNIVAIKHATGTVDGVDELLSECDIIVLSGDDSITWPLMALGASGVISVIANLTPGLMKDLTQAALCGDGDKVLALHRTVGRLCDAIGKFGPNPIPIKTAMALAGLMSEEFRLPLCPVDAAGREAIERILRRFDLL